MLNWNNAKTRDAMMSSSYTLKLSQQLYSYAEDSETAQLYKGDEWHNPVLQNTNQ